MAQLNFVNPVYIQQLAEIILTLVQRTGNLQADHPDILPREFRLVTLCRFNFASVNVCDFFAVCFKLINFIFQMNSLSGHERSTTFVSCTGHIVFIHMAWTCNCCSQSAPFCLIVLNILCQTMVYTALSCNDLVFHPLEFGYCNIFSSSYLCYISEFCKAANLFESLNCYFSATSASFTFLR